MVLRNSFVVCCLLIVIGVISNSCSIPSSKFNDSQVFRYNESSNISSLDPAFAKDISDIWGVNQLFNGLVQLDAELHVQPDIAKSWEISDDGKIYTFHLRNDVYFHEHSLFGENATRAVTAHDFEYSFNRLLDPQVSSPGGWTLQNVASFSAINDTVFKIELKNPFPPFLGLLGMKYCSVVPQEIVEYYGSEFRSNPIGTGPFQFKLWVENTKLIFRKNPLFFEKDERGQQLPYMEAVAITFLSDKQSEFLQFVQGNIDFLNSIDPSYKNDILTADGELQERYSQMINMKKGPYLNTEYLGVFLGDSTSALHSELLRKAINYGFDREKMILYLRNGIGTPALNGFIPKGLPSFNEMKGFTYQPELAKEFIQKYIEETGDKNPTFSIVTNSMYVDLCEYIQRELQNLGLNVAIDVVPPSSLRQSKAKGKLPLFRASWVADYPDAENYLSLFYSKNKAPNGPNYTHFSNDYFDTLYEKSIVITNVDERAVLYQKMDSIIISKAPIIPLYYDEAVRFTRKNVEDLGMSPTNMLTLKNVKKIN